MFVITKITWEISTGRVTEREGYEYEGPVALACGAPSGQQQLANEQAAYYQTLTSNAQAEFGDSSQIFNELSAAFSPIFKAGPNQEGYSAGELNALNSEASAGVGQAYNSAEQATNERLASEGGGTSLLPSGVTTKASESLASAGASQLAGEQSQIINNDYTQGYNQWLAAATGLENAPTVFGTSTGAAGAANQGGSSANSTYSAIATENASPFNAVVGALGGIGGMAAGGLAGGWAKNNT